MEHVTPADKNLHWTDEEIQQSLQITIISVKTKVKSVKLYKTGRELCKQYAREERVVLDNKNKYVNTKKKNKKEYMEISQ